MKILALPDLHEKADFHGILQMALSDADLVALVGDLTNGSVQAAQTVINTIRTFQPQIMAVPGNMDSMAVNDYLTTEGLNLHGQNRTVDNISFVGVGGALPFYGKFVFSEDELATLLEQAANGAQTPSVLLCHQPPYGTQTDLAKGNHVGSHAVRRFIEEQQPLVCFTGHIHESYGVDTIGETVILNPGRFWREGYYAYAEIVDGSVAVAELRSAR